MLAEQVERLLSLSVHAAARRITMSDQSLAHQATRIMCAAMRAPTLATRASLLRPQR
jgi:hypothetical protein